MPSLRLHYSDIEQWSPPLANATVTCLLLFAIAVVGFAVDHRVITGAPAWLKPVKFSASGAIYLFTLAWMVRDLPQTRTLRVASNLIAWILVLEIVLIQLQAARGTSSHFNINSPLDTAAMHRGERPFVAGSHTVLFAASLSSVIFVAALVQALAGHPLIHSTG